MAKRTDKEKPDAGTRQQRLPLTWDASAAARQNDLPFEVERPPSAEPEPEAAPAAPAPDTPDTPTEALQAEEVPPDESPPEPPQMSLPDENEQPAPPLPSEDVPLPQDTAAGPEAEEAEAPPEESEESEESEETAIEDESDTAPPETATPADDTPLPEDVQIIELSTVEMTLGQRLMESRGACNLTITNVAQKTRIPKYIIEQIETDRIKQLPPPIYTRSYVAQLCREYGIDPQPILSELDQLLQRREDEDDSHRLVVTAQNSESGSKVRYRLAGRRGPNGNRVITPTMLAVAATVAVLTLLVVAGLGLRQWRKHRRKMDVIEAVEAVPMPGTPVDLEEFIIPQQLPLKELAIPSD
ncbi:MAG: hypothetical protein HN742_10905 [Lentisphaerae bacterium]|nr:hypothetical protein [Lentisphaerota bacterium]MBT4818007.1 hypothetical protein [Lentisphaerota bacterium]MBT5607254.1 hypothetical protein [Lentisphaerota bacterium]MBT7058817.1 hypothetical protein [Lentisphaerota bacterium]MBT7842373.1 hypothetical protein [Lentisphaerota bacterium]